MSDGRRQGPRVDIGGFGFDAIGTADAAERIVRDVLDGRGGRLVTPNVDILRQAAHDIASGRLLSEAELVVADGMPLVWASRLARRPLPERVAGSTLAGRLIDLASRAGVAILLVGGEQGVAARAAAAIAFRHPGARVDWYYPPFGFEDDPNEMTALSKAVEALAPCISLCGLGFPRQDRVGSWLYERHRGSWFVGCGGSIAFLAGERSRAPALLQTMGLEWLYRLALEPRRLARRYLVDDIPFAARLLVAAARDGGRAPTGY